MKIEFSNNNLSTVIAMHDDGDSGEVVIETGYDGQDSWHTFSSLNQLDEFIGMLQVLRDRSASKIGSGIRYADRRPEYNLNDFK